MREQRHAAHVKPLASDDRREPSAQRQNDGVGNQIGREHPRALVGARREAPGNVRQRDVGDAGVQHLHEGRQRDRERNDPGIDRRAPLAVWRSWHSAALI